MAKTRWFSLEFHLYGEVRKIEGEYASIKDVLGIIWASVGIGVTFIELKDMTTGDMRSMSGSFPGLSDLMKILKDFE